MRGSHVDIFCQVAMKKCIIHIHLSEGLAVRSCNRKNENSQIKEWEKAKKKRRKIPKSKSGRKKRKERKFPIKDRRKTEEMCRKVVGPGDI